MTLFDYEQENPPSIKLTGTIRKPTDGEVIGHVGVDVNRDGYCGVFPRDRDEHFFRKYNGYALSDEVVNDVLDTNAYAIYIVERDRANRLLEFEPLDFATGKRIAYSPEQDTIVEDHDAIEAQKDVFHDIQRIAPVDNIRRSWRRRDCTIVKG